jgi:polyisoprenyl-teichoic acid--peptidoglycan teichoic acid transferase
MSQSNPMPRVTRRSIGVRLSIAAVIGALTFTAVAPQTSTAASSKKTTTKPKAKSKATSKKAPTTVKRKPPKSAKGSKKVSDQWAPNGRPPAIALNFDPNPPSSDKNYPSAKTDAEALTKVQPDGKTIHVLLVGSDARPGEPVDRSRGDAIHLFSYNPTLKKGSIIGFPRDTWVTMPSGDSRKLNEVLSVAGPDVFLETFNKLTGLKVTRYVITGFAGFKAMVDGVGGINIEVKPAMNDKASAAQFQQGWFQMNGRAALAFTRARKTLPNGDFDRSANQNKMLVGSLYRLRESTDNIRALLNWVLLGRKNTISNVKPGDWMYMAQASRAIDPTSLKTAVIPAAAERVGDQDAVVVNEEAFAGMMTDVADGVLGN